MLCFYRPFELVDCFLRLLIYPIIILLLVLLSIIEQDANNHQQLSNWSDWRPANVAPHRRPISDRSTRKGCWSSERANRHQQHSLIELKESPGDVGVSMVFVDVHYESVDLNGLKMATMTMTISKKTTYKMRSITTKIKLKRGPKTTPAKMTWTMMRAMSIVMRLST